MEEKKKFTKEAVAELVERRLNLPGGTLIRECGHGLATRFGEHLAMLAKSSNLIEEPEHFDLAEGKRIPEVAQKLRVQGRALREAGLKKKAEEIEHYTKIVKEYIVKTYGEKVKDDEGVYWYGDEIEVLKTRHLKKVAGF